MRGAMAQVLIRLRCRAKFRQPLRPKRNAGLDLRQAMALGQHHSKNRHDLGVNELCKHFNQFAALDERRGDEIMHATNAEPREHHRLRDAR